MEIRCSSSSSDLDVHTSSGTDKWQRETKTPKTSAAASEKHGVSNRGASFIATVVLQDMQIVNQDNKSQVIDRSKIRKKRQKKRED